MCIPAVYVNKVNDIFEKALELLSMHIVCLENDKFLKEPMNNFLGKARLTTPDSKRFTEKVNSYTSAAEAIQKMAAQNELEFDLVEDYLREIE